MASNVLKELYNEIPEEKKNLHRKQTQIIMRINEILKEKNWTQKGLAEKMGKRPSEISKWLGGAHNFTLKSLAKLEAELGTEIISVPKRHSFVTSETRRVSMTVYVNKPNLKGEFVTSRVEKIKPKKSTVYHVGKTG